MVGLFSRFSRWFQTIFKRKHLKVGIYGPPNAGKTTLANRISMDWLGEEVGSVSEVPHETREALEKREIVIEADGARVTFDIVDTPGVTTKIDYHEFVEEYGLNDEEGRERAREATQGIIDAIKWLDKVEGVLLVLDSTQDPFTQVNLTILGNLEARDLPVLIVANKIDRQESSPASLRAAFQKHTVVPVSALTGFNMENLYRTMVKYFR